MASFVGNALLAEVAEWFPGGQALLELKSRIDTWRTNVKDAKELDVLHDQFDKLVQAVHCLRRKLREDIVEEFKVAVEDWRNTLGAMNKSWTWLQVVKSTHHRQQIETLKNGMMFWHLKVTSQTALLVRDLDDRVEEHVEITEAKLQRASLEVQTARSEVQQQKHDLKQLKEEHKVELENHKEEVHGLIEEKVREECQQIQTNMQASFDAQVEAKVSEKLAELFSKMTQSCGKLDFVKAPPHTEIPQLAENVQPEVEVPDVPEANEERLTLEVKLQQLESDFDKRALKIRNAEYFDCALFDQLKVMEEDLFKHMRTEFRTLSKEYGGEMSKTQRDQIWNYFSREIRSRSRTGIMY